MSQTYQILNHLKERPLTPLDALKNYGCMRLSARIYDLKQQGYNIYTEIIANGDKRYAQYFMESND